MSAARSLSIRAVPPGETLNPILVRCECLRSGNALGHRLCVLDARVGVLEGGDHREDGHTVLVGLGTARGERASVMDAVDGDRDALTRVAWTKEVAVHRVHRTVFGKGALRSQECLGENLSAVDPAGGHRVRGTGEDVLRRPCLRRIEIDDLEQSLDGLDGVVFRAHGFLSAPRGAAPLVV